MSAINARDKTGKTPLIRACSAGNNDMVKSLLAHKDIDVDVGDNDKNTALHYATVIGLPGIIGSLIDKGANVNFFDKHNNTPLNFSLVCRSKIAPELSDSSDKDFQEGISVLLSKGADPNLASVNGWAPLHNACGNKASINIIKMLVKHGADVDRMKVIGYSPMMVACQEGFVDAVKMLITLKADVNIVGEKGKTAFWIACKDGRYDCVSALLSANCSCDSARADGCSPAWIAALRGRAKILQLLIKHKADINKADDKGHTPVWAACHEGHAESLDVLMKGGADLNKAGSSTPLWIACQNGHIKCISILLNAGVDKEAPIENGTTPLIIASEANNDKVVQLLLKHKVNVHTENSQGLSALGMACLKGHDKCLQLLAAAGSKIDEADTNGITPLHLAVYNNNAKCVEILIQVGANLECRDKDGHTPLHLAVFKNRPECVKLLIDGGADQTVTDIKGATPLHLATDKSHTVCAQLLLGETPASLNVPKKDRLQDLDISLHISELENLVKGMLGTGGRSKTAAPKPEMPTAVAQIGPMQKARNETTHIFDIATSFLRDLNISGAYFDPSFDVCFCEMCHTKRGDKLKYTRGNPPRDYGLPIGWCKFGLRLKPQAVAENIFEDWHVAFHGTRVQNLKKILKNGDLLKPGDVTFDGEELSIPPNHWDPKNPAMVPPPGHDVRKLYFSPSIKYSGCSCYAPVWCWLDPKTGETHHIRVAFQVRIKPGVYEISPQTIGATKELDPLFPNDTLEWSTNRFGVSMLVGLLIKIDGHTSERKVDEARAAAKHEPTLPQASFDESRPVRIQKEYIYKTRRGGHEIKLRQGDDCLLLSKTGASGVIMHPKVDGSITLPLLYIRL